VIAREKSGDRQLDLFEGGKFKYRCILTTNHQKTEKEVATGIRPATVSLKF
jgi:hypothetical protein